MNPRVVIIGGGVAGMTAAHELIDRNFDVTVLERDMRPGGKAKTYDAPSPLSSGKLPLPGEHGFRFFPHFYQNIRDTMDRISLQSGTRTVKDNLVQAPRAMLAREGKPPIELPTGPSRSIVEIQTVLRDLFQGSETGLTSSDYLYFAEKILEIMSACPERALKQFESETWWHFMEADNQSKAFQTYLVEGLTSCLVAARAKEANVRAGGVVLTQLFYGLLQGVPIDWVLNGPTTNAWLDPWLVELQSKNVDFKLGAEVTGFALTNDKIASVEFNHNGVTKQISGDYYVGAVPVEVMQHLWSHEMQALDPTFARNLQLISSEVGWMTGLQYFLTVDAPITPGHITFIDSPWSLTAISQPQFWPGVDLGQYGDGSLHGILSVDISEWNKAGVLYGLPALQCTATQIAEEVWQQMVVRLNVGGLQRIPASVPPNRMIDPNVIFNSHPSRNDAPLFINKVGTWARRPDNETPVRNLFLASDYVRTDTNLATMEAANESARRAVQMIVDFSGVGGSCRWFSLPDPFVHWLGPARKIDCMRYGLGLDWVRPTL
jgi:15-cis-phytoene desaturase